MLDLDLLIQYFMIIHVDKDGNGIFYCDGGSVSVWVKK